MLKYKIINSSLNYKDKKYSKFIDINKIINKIFNKINKKNIYFSIKFNNNNIYNYYYNIIKIKGGSVIDTIKKDDIDISLLICTNEKKSNEIGIGSDGIVYKPPYCPIIKYNINIDEKKIDFVDNVDFLKKIINEYYDNEIETLLNDNYIGKIIKKEKDINEILKIMILNDIKIKFLQKK